MGTGQSKLDPKSKSEVEREADERKLYALNIATEYYILRLPGVYDNDKYNCNMCMIDCANCLDFCCECCDEEDCEKPNAKEKMRKKRARAIIQARPIISWEQLVNIKGMSKERVEKLKKYAEYTTPPFDLCPPGGHRSHYWSTYDEEYVDWEDFKNNFPRKKPFCYLCFVSIGVIDKRDKNTINTSEDDKFNIYGPNNLCHNSAEGIKFYNSPEGIEYIKMCKEYHRKEEEKYTLERVEIPDKGIFMVKKKIG